MQTDIERLAEVFSGLGIGFHRAVRADAPGEELILEAKKGANVTGYTGFVAEFYFHADGSFDEVGIWE